MGRTQLSHVQGRTHSLLEPHPDTHRVQVFCWQDSAVSRKALRNINPFIPGKKEDDEVRGEV